MIDGQQHIGIERVRSSGLQGCSWGLKHIAGDEGDNWEVLGALRVVKTSGDL